MLMTALTDPLFDEKLRNPFSEFLFPTFGKGEVGPMRNVFSTAFGVGLIPAFWCYLIVWTVAGLWLWRRLRATTPPDAAALPARVRSAA
jgi:hypothetical protein